MDKKKILLLLDSSDQGLLYGIARFVSERNHWRTFLYPINEISGSREGLARFIRWCDWWRPHGIITRTIDHDLGHFFERDIKQFGGSVPILNFGAEYQGLRHHDFFSSVRTDERALCELAISHFLERGVRHLVFYRSGSSKEIVIRQRLFEKICAQYDIIGIEYNARSEYARSEYARSEYARSEYARSEYARSEYARSEYARSEYAKSEYAKSECAKSEVDKYNGHNKETEDPQSDLSQFGSSDLILRKSSGIFSEELSTGEKGRFLKWLANQPKPLGIWCGTDALAVSLLDLLSEEAIKVPEEVCVLGTGNALSICLMADPPLSSIDTSPEVLGYQGAVLLDQKLGGMDINSSQTILIPPKNVVARKSTDYLTVDNPDVARIVHYIKMNAVYGITVADVQREFDIIPRTLQRLMKKYLGRTAEAEIRNVKIEYAKELLTDPTLTMSQIAEQSGFTSSTYFIRVFKEQTSFTPAEFRAKYSEKGISLFTPKFDRNQIRIKPLAERDNDRNIGTDSVNPLRFPIELSIRARRDIDRTAEEIQRAKERGAARILAFGAHSIKDGLSRVMVRLMEGGWITHFATDGAGVIHDWEYAFQGKTGENLRRYTAEGQFGIWDETGKYINAALIIGAWQGLGYGDSIGKMIEEEGIRIPPDKDLLDDIVSGTAAGNARNSLDRAAAAADLLAAKKQFGLRDGFVRISHPYREFSLAHRARLNGVPFTCHPMFGYDVIYTHPMNKGAAVGRAAESDFLSFVDSVSHLEKGVYLSIGSSVMSPMIFGKALSMVRNISLRHGRPVNDFSIQVVDLLETDWNWNCDKEPPLGDPAYNLRFCRQFSQMGGTMNYCGADCRCWLTALLRKLENYD